MLPTPGADTVRDGLARIARIADGERMRRLDALERLWKGVPSDLKANFWDTSVPLTERAPYISAQLPKAAGERLVALTFGEGKFPSLKVGESAWGVILSETETALLQDAVDDAVKSASIKTVARSLLREGLKLGSCFALVSARKGRVVVDVLTTKTATPTFENGELTCVEIKYRYEQKNDEGVTEHWWYKRVIDAQGDCVYRGKVREDGFEPEWLKDPQSVIHNLGFVPALWHRNMPDPSDCDEVDGVALFDGLEDELEALDMALSQRHRNGRYNGEPQLVRIGAGEPAMGKQGREATAPPKGFSWFDSVVQGVKRVVGGGSATQKSPSKIWDLPAGADAKMVESTGAGEKILTSDADGIRRMVLEAIGVVIASPETIAANASAALMKEIHAPTLAVCDGLREEYGPVVVDLINLVLRVALAVHKRGEFVALRTIKSVANILDRFHAPTVDGPLWVGVPLTLTWGEYFEPTWSDVQSAVQSAVTGSGNRAVLTLRQAVQLLAKVIGNDDVDKTLVELSGESDAMAMQTRDTIAALADKPEVEAPEATPAPVEAAPVAPPVAGGVMVGPDGEPVKFFAYELEDGIVTINEVRRSKGLGPLPNGQGDLTVPEYKARNASLFSTAAAATEGAAASTVRNADTPTEQ